MTKRVTKTKDGYVKYGNYFDLVQIISSKLWNPVFISGPTGNGKTTMVSEACKELNRDLVRINFTQETDEDDLIGGFRLQNGETVYSEGPVIQAMKNGSVLLLDEIDLSSPKIMCLQPVLEGNGIYIKKIKQYVEPAPGFNIIATANTKGKGSDDGRYIGTNILNEAFLDRFSTWLDQEYPEKKVEEKILKKRFEQLGVKDCDDFISKLITWASMTRQAFDNNSVSELISTRRLIQTASNYAIFNDKLKAINNTVARFDPSTRKAFTDFYTTIDETVVKKEDPAAEPEKVETPAEQTTTI